MERVKTGDLRHGAQTARNFIEKSRLAQYLLRTIGVFGVSLVMSDGVLTPAQSVLGAIQGLQVVKPDITNKTIVGVSCGIIVVLFLVQPLGTTKLASSFAPIVIVWLLFNMAFGIYVGQPISDYTQSR
jgi:KUP system potassium uptake protein